MLHNTMSRKKEVFTPRPEMGNKVTMYVCGVTVYDYSHIGHARVYVAFDILYRHLMRLGYDVTYCRNFTDIDDKIIKRASESGESCESLTDRFIDAFHEDMAALGCLRPTVEPRATQHVDDIIDFTQRLIDSGNAYAVDGDVYFAVDSLPKYGALSGRNQEDNRAGERIKVDGRKKNAADFALWKSSKPGEPTWSSPWGEGRPGWHIECSAMIEKILGNSIDIHGGGQDLVFPHHENELAQSTAAAQCGCGKSHGGGGDGGEQQEETEFVRYWVHNGFVKVDSEKMSKSLGNFFTIREVLNRYDAYALRFMLLGTHYRAPINYTQRALEEASDRVYYLYQTLEEAKQCLRNAEEVESTDDKKKKVTGVAAEGLEIAADTPGSVAAAVADDLNTPLALASLSAPLKFINDLLTTKKGKKAVGRIDALRALTEAVEDVMDTVGLPRDGGADVLQRLKDLALVRADMTAEEVEEAIERRTTARKEKNFEESDRIRDELAARGVALMDGAVTTWRPSPVLEAE